MTSTTEHPERWPEDDFVPTEELARRQGIRPINSVDDLAAEVDPFESDEEYEAFLADLYASRRAGLASASSSSTPTSPPRSCADAHRTPSPASSLATPSPSPSSPTVNSPSGPSSAAGVRAAWR